ncbi:hypothetical protein [Alkalihalobacillus sp. LMS39]|uniref:hypothetical protein n=1 Tax=Alkalihalobacillus sp. LMS39 TaxID=2924032 RepID=UPI001FB499D4|nr:hypothetical protein [Alkalihalobacillus sp. LMS39]UOE95313.1 hypothetical protein MM271_06760 [Alkalihalobacillus sp. LMS39]
MTKEEDLKIVELLKRLGVKSEKKLQQYVHSLLADEDFILLMSKILNKHSQTIKQLQNNTETFATQLNMPTKRDVAHIAKLAQQIEEKIDDLEEQVMQLTAQGSEGETLNKQGELGDESIHHDSLNKKMGRQHAKLKAMMKLWQSLPTSPLITNVVDRDRKHD